MNRLEHQKDIDDGWIECGKLMVRFFKEDPDNFLNRLVNNNVFLSILWDTYRVLRKRKLVEEISESDLNDARTLTDDHSELKLLKVAKAIVSINYLYKEKDENINQ